MLGILEIRIKYSRLTLYKLNNDILIYKIY